MKTPPSISVADYLAEPRRFSCVLDARTPAEFDLDCLPGAVNTPVLSNDERVIVGTLDKQVSSFEAKKLGAKLVAKNIAMLLDTALFAQEKEWAPLVYCWRGGNRSGSLAHILRKIGWGACQLEGGYKAFRSHVIADLAQLPKSFTFRVVAGPTGVGKTKLLHALSAQGAQVLDLEGLAKHKGSLLGAQGPQQPSQKHFETLIWQHLRNSKSEHPIYVESESAIVGNLRVPEALMSAIRQSDCIVLNASAATRTALLLEDYPHFVNEPSRLTEKLQHLTQLHGRSVVDHWCALIHHAQWQLLIEALLSQHYDPAYHKSLRRNFTKIDAAQHLNVPNESTSCFAKIARDILNENQQSNANKVSNGAVTHRF